MANESTGAFFDRVTMAEYAALAFGVGSDGKPSDRFEGGIYAGRGTAWERIAEGDSASGARLIPVRAGKVFVRWCREETLSGTWSGPPPDNAGELPRWAPAAGPWWVSDNMAELIVRRTTERFGEDGDSGRVAREFSAVKHEWGSDMRGVIVCRTKIPIRVLVGVGRPVLTTAPDASGPLPLGDRDLQYVILTEHPRRTFRAHEFFELVHLCRSTELVRWWKKAAILSGRGRPMNGQPPTGPRPADAGGYPGGVTRVPPA
jgi:hypothetical protein